MITLKIPPEKAILLINERIDDMKTIRKNPHGLEYYDFIGWCSKTWKAIDAIYEAGDPHPEEIRTIGLSNCSCNSHTAAHILADVYSDRLLDYIREIEDSMKARE
ncbi:MAG: hypothetical protein M0Q92_06175 [Methanoregula sp.]|jgi:hypothetical protein|nr:hypothetical protein [Methanoregula sp.]